MNAGKETRLDKLASAFPIVGVGASVGGLKAAGIFLEHMPADAGMAYVFVFHLDPKHKSTAAEILQARTRMPVAQVTGSTTVRANHVYVVPPDHGLALRDGELVLTELSRTDGRPTVIDHFFRTLAEHAGERAIGVVLSGTGSEGSQGLAAIKEAGGLTAAQIEAEAEYAGMPHSAIATGLVDVVLPVAEIPEKLIEVGNSPVGFAVPAADGAADESDASALQKIFVQLRTRTGHDFSQYKHSTLLRRIARRMQVHRLRELGAYVELLRTEPAEAEALRRELLISVTNFFRDPDAMERLKHEVGPKLLPQLEGQTLRVWVPGCASGEEAYSLAMLLSETCDGLATPPRLQIFASDVDQRALATARRGVYPDAIAGDVSAVRLKRFFDRQGESYVVKPSLREMLLFARHNLLQDPPFSTLNLISCRNLLIYLKPAAQAHALALFHFALQPQGYLFLGSSETTGSSGKLFNEIDRTAKIFQARRAPTADLELPLLATPSRATVRSHDSGESRKRFEDIARAELLTHYAPPCVIVDENHNVTFISGHVGKYLEPGAGVANFNLLDMARDGLRLELRSALFQVFHAGATVLRKPLRLRADGEDQGVALTVRPLAEADGHALVVFEELESTAAAPAAPADNRDGMAAQIEAELRATRESLQATIEELETSNEELRVTNEELQSVNEELRSTGEELETRKEELQSTNEELLTVNQELQVKNDELARSNSDLGNLMASTDIGTLFLDAELRVRLYTPRLTDVFNLISSDLGRPFVHITGHFEDDSLVADAECVLRDATVIERELGSKDGRFYQVRLRPYRTGDNQLDGVVITFVDVSERHRLETHTQGVNRGLEADRAYLEGIVATARMPMLVLDSALRVVKATAAFERVFQVAPQSIQGKPLYELSGGAWNVPELRRLLEEVLPHHTTVEDFRLRHDFGAGERILYLNARRLQTPGAAPLILLAFEDVTARENAERAVGDRDARSAFLLQFSDKLRSAPNADALASRAVELVAKKLAVDCCCIASSDQDKDQIRIHHVYVQPGTSPLPASLRWSDFPTLRERMATQMAVVGDAANDRGLRAADRRSLAELEFRACIAAPVRDDGGTPVWMLVAASHAPRRWLATDIALMQELAERMWTVVERARTQEALEASEKRFRGLVTTTSDAVFRMSGDWSEMTNLKGGDFLASLEKPERGWFDKYIPPREQVRVRAAMDAAIRDKSLFSLEHRVQRADGDIGWSASRATPVFDASGAIVEWFGAASDITERKRKDREAARLASIVASSDDAIISKDLDGIVKTWNRGAEKTFGYTAEEARGRSITELIIPADRLEEEADILRRIAAGESIEHYETVRRHKDGTLLHMSVTISPLKVDGQIIGASKIARDITERKRRERHRQLLVNELNHRVKNTLSTVQSIAMQTLGGSPENAELVWRFESRLMALAKTHALLSRSHWERIGLHALLAQALAPFATENRERIEIVGTDATLRPNEVLALGMVFHELATNATKYGALSGATGKLRVVSELHAADARLRITWTETGGPRVAEPDHRGFGTRLIAGGIAHELNGEVHMDYLPEGLVWSIDMPLVADLAGEE